MLQALLAACGLQMLPPGHARSGQHASPVSCQRWKAGRFKYNRPKHARLAERQRAGAGRRRRTCGCAPEAGRW